MARFSYFLWATRQFFSLPFAVQWRFILVRLPWLVPLAALHITSKKPHPFVLQLPSRGKHTIPVYVFVPPKQKRNGQAFPIHLDCHGGGFFMGSCLEQAPYCSQVARELGKIVLSIDYRMGPLHHFPDAIEDAEDVLKAALDANMETPAGKLLRLAIAKKIGYTSEKGILDAETFSISGFSSGGNIALNLAISVQTPDVTWPCLFPDPGNPIPTLLFFPSFDQTLLPHERPMPKHLPQQPKTDGAKPPGLALSAHMAPTYLDTDRRTHPRSSPGLADMRKGLHQRAKILLVLPEIDTLAVQSEAWLAKMEEEGRSGCVTVERAPGMTHGWTQFPDLWLSGKARAEKRRVTDVSLDFMRAC